MDLTTTIAAKRKKITVKSKGKGPKSKPARQSKAKDDGRKQKAKNGVIDTVEANSAAEKSDGEGALNKVNDAEARDRDKRGPANSTLVHWHKPVAVIKANKPVWLFECKYCKW